MDRLALQTLTPAQADQLDKKRERVHPAAESRDQVKRRFGRPPGREQIIDAKHMLSLGHGIVVNLERVGAVLEIVRRADCFRRQLPDLPDWREPGADAIGDRRADDEAAAFDADDEIDAFVVKRRREAVDYRVKARRVAQERRDVVEENPALRKIRDVTNFLLELIRSHLMLNSVSPAMG